MILTLASITLTIGARVDADTVVRFRFSAVGPGDSVGGTGSFSFADGLSTVALGDVKGFSFIASVFDDVHGGPQYFNYDSSMLKTFSATFDTGPSSPTLTSLGLSTSPYQPPDDPLFPELAFNITSLAADGAFMERWKSGADAGSYAAGPVTITDIATGVTAPVPEPSTLVMLGLGALGVSLAWRHRRNSA